jgi:hypothetical protein
MTAALLIARALMGKLAGAAASLWRWLWANPWRLSLVVVAVLAFMLWRTDSRADRAERQATIEQEAHKVSLASIATLRSALDAKNAETELRAKAYQGARQTGAADARRNAEAYRPTARRIDAVRGAMGQNGDKCETPVDVRELLR